MRRTAGSGMGNSCAQPSARSSTSRCSSCVPSRGACGDAPRTTGSMPWNWLNSTFARESHPVDVIEQVAHTNDWSFERNGDDEISISVAGMLDRLSRLLLLDGGFRGAASGLRLRHQGSREPHARGHAAAVADQRADAVRPFRPVGAGRRDHVPPVAAAWPAASSRPASRSRCCCPARSKPANAISRRSSSSSGRACRPRTRWPACCSKPTETPERSRDDGRQRAQARDQLRRFRSRRHPRRHDRRGRAVSRSAQAGLQAEDRFRAGDRRQEIARRRSPNTTRRKR